MPNQTLPSRTFGVEIEARGLYFSQVVETIQELGYSAQDDGYHHEATPFWKVMGDGSINGRLGFEAVSPVLSGEEGIRELRRVSRALNRAGATVNRSCGLHVHVDVSDLTAAEIATVICRYAQFEGEIDTFMPPSRRTGNQWARTTRNWAARIRDRSLREVCQVSDEQRGRYCKLNLESFRRQGTIEVRHHSGTLNPTKIENWVRFLVHFIEACRETSVSTVRSNEETETRRAARTVSVPPGDTLFREVPESVQTFYRGRAEALIEAQRQRENPEPAPEQ